MKKKRVLFMNLTPRWGMLHYSSQFCNAVWKNNNIVLKVAIASYYKSNLYLKSENFIRIRTNPDIKNFIIDSLNIFYHLIFIYKIIRFKPDIVHFLDNHPWYIFYWKLFKFLWFKIYVTQHDPTLHSGESNNLLWKIAAKVNKFLRDNSDKLFVHWDILKNEVINKYNISDKKIFSIAHGNYNFFKDHFSKWWKIQKNTFLFFWRIVDYKWLDLLLLALEEVIKNIPDVKLIIAWPWNMKKYLPQIKSLKKNIDIYNYNIEPEEAYIYFEKSEFIVLPYKDATGSWVIPVAYAFSKPVIVTNVWELPSIVKDNITGYVVDSNNIQQLSKKIIEMLISKNQAKKMWKEWRKFTENELSWDKIINKIYNYEE